MSDRTLSSRSIAAIGAVVGTAAIGGVAWAQTRGISAVEVQLDDGPWQHCELGAALNDDTWRQWALRWSPASTGHTSIRCRATNAAPRLTRRSPPPRCSAA